MQKRGEQWHDSRRAVWVPLALYKKLQAEALRRAQRIGVRISPGAIATVLLRRALK